MNKILTSILEFVVMVVAGVAAFAVMWVAIDGLIEFLSVAYYQEWTLIIVIVAAWAIDHNRHEVRL